MEEEGSSLLDPDVARTVAREDTETEINGNRFNRCMRVDQESHIEGDQIDPWEKKIYIFSIGGGIISCVGLCFCVSGVLGFIIIICLIAQAMGVAMGKWVLALGEGTASMRAIGSAIREGSQAYVATMFTTIAILLVPTAIVVFSLYLMQIAFAKALMIAITFIFGAACSSAAGVIGMWSSTRANARVAQMACSSTFRETLVVALRSGSVCGITVVSMSVFSISVLFTVCYICVEGDFTRIPELLIGYGFGASFVALFAQLGGGIFTKAADVGADMCGKIELDIPEDDPRNPAVIADLVGDNVGDCCARGADLFESLSAEIIAAMILAGSLARNSNALSVQSTQLGYLLFPLVIHVIDLIVSTIGVLCVSSTADGSAAEEATLDPMTLLKQGYKVAILCSSLGFILACRFMLHVESAPYAWRHFAACGFVGMATGFLIVLITQYYTDFNYAPVKQIAQAAEMGGHGTNVIAGLAVGMKSTMAPVLIVGIAILLSYNLGKTSGLDFQGTPPNAWNTLGADVNPGLSAGLFGTAVATMGMLSNLTYVLAMDVFGPIADNAAGIVEMSPECPASARETMDRLDAAGNTTKAFTKGFAVSSAGLACFLLFRAFLDIIEEGSGKKVVVDIVAPEVFVGGIVGGATVFLFAGIAMEAVGETAQKVVVEVRRQFNEIPGIATGEREPQYGVCVSIVSSAAIKKMIKPGFLVLAMPIIVGKVFHAIGDATGDELLGAKAITSYLVCSSMTAMLMALFLNNGGGAWDNAKKLIEAGNYGGKGSDAHKAAVTGDTVGDPCKDTAGPSLHVLMKLTATVIMVIGPLITMPTVAGVATTTPLPQ